ncbi:type VI secretion system baseplate subunit TssF [Trinickia dinghuensis]|uniref:Type VI secretion system baseplate subunit TssF n=1 Tax=Trinickia dinghuensis TaxID=2291023 RepID=A0A3D8JQR0_9BURK|nr:type VI secretion system baseplate subunit TssF [Trinickia dinghuensis]RDU95045.1 type VI secretion system baseplate subunit TssF [Trinickia dinghuensis]
MQALLPYYERELAFLRRYSSDFADRYPKIAARLAPTGEQSDDPHVERMIESFALLSARINKKLDDDRPEFTEALFEVLYPHYLRPFPSCSIAQFGLPRGGMPAHPMTIPRGTALTSREIRGVSCRFRTAYDVTQAPLRLARARHTPLAEVPPSAVTLPGDASALLSFTFETTLPEGTLGELNLSKLRAYLHGEQSFIAALTDCLFMKAIGAYVETPESRLWRPLAAMPIEPAGFADADALIDYPAKSHPAYRLLAEYFAFPEKFDFIDFDFGAMLKTAGRCRRLTVHVALGELRDVPHIERLVESLSVNHVRLFCTPVVNLFTHRGEPIHVSHEAVSYPVVADASHAGDYEVYSIDDVRRVETRADGQTITELRPFYALHHDEAARVGRYWFARRNDWVARNSPGYETEISVVDADFDPLDARTDTLSLALTCTNRDLPARLAIGLEGGDLFAEPDVATGAIGLLSRPSPSVRVARGTPMRWRLVSHLALNHVSLSADGLAPLKELLALYDTRRTPVSARHIAGIVGIEQKPAVHWLPGRPYATFVRGVEVRLTVDESYYVGTSLATFVRVLDTFFGLFVRLNSFVQLVAVAGRTGEEIMRCKPRSAESTLA